MGNWCSNLPWRRHARSLLPLWLQLQLPVLVRLRYMQPRVQQVCCCLRGMSHH